MQDKGYSAKVEFDDNANIFHGETINLRDVITKKMDESYSTKAFTFAKKT